MKPKFFEKEGLFRSLFTAHVIVLLHILILAGIGLSVVLFRGVYLYLPWIMGGVGILVLLTAWFFYRQIRSGSSDISKVLARPEFQDRNVEVKLMGGLASFKMSGPNGNAVSIDHQLDQPQSQVLLEQKTKKTEDTLYTLKALYEKELITKEDFERAKQELIQG